MPTFKLTKKTFTSSFMHFTFTFSEYSRLLFPQRLWKWASTISFRKCERKVVLLVIYLFNYDSSKSTFFMLNMAFVVLFLTFCVQFLLYKLKFFVSCNNLITRTSFFFTVTDKYILSDISNSDIWPQIWNSRPRIMISDRGFTSGLED